MLDEACRRGGGVARAGADDVFAVGPAEVVFPAVTRFAAEIEERCDLQLQWTKSVVYTEGGQMPPGAMEGLSLAGETVDGVFESGLMVYGVPVGSRAYVMFKLREVAAVIVRDAKRTSEVLRQDRQALWTALRLSVTQRFGYLQQLVAPSLTEEVAAELDEALWAVLEAACGFQVPRWGEQDGLVLRVPEVPCLDRRTFQEWVVRQPARLHGWGLRSLREVCGPAWLGTLETAVPFMAGMGKVCPQLAGGEECWAEGAPDDRWRCMLESGCVEGRELEQLWGRVTGEAVLCCNFLGEELPGVMAAPTGSIGDGSVTGSTRGKVVEARENLRAKVLDKVLLDLRPKSTRAAWSWRQRDKVSSAWLLAIPAYDTALSSPEFTEAAANSLCLPSQACRERVGEPVKGRVVVDLYGDAIQATAVEGDHWRTRHNAFLQLIHRMCLWSGLVAQMEVFNLFSGLINQPGLSRAERARDLQGLVPDLRVLLPGAAVRGAGPGGGGGAVGGRVGAPGGAALAGQATAVLHEVKVISCSRSRYKPGWTRRAVDVRASQLQSEYLGKARRADRRQGTPAGQVGRVEAKLVSLGEVRGVVAGQWGEVSEPTHALLDAMATSRVRVAGPSQGRRGRLRTEEAERAITISGLRRRVGVMAVRCQVSSLLGRLETLGTGGAAAQGRRWQATELDRQWRREVAAHSLATRQGFFVMRSGFGKKD